MRRKCYLSCSCHRDTLIHKSLLCLAQATRVESLSRDTEEKYSAELKAVERRKDLGIQIQHIAEEEKKVCFFILCLVDLLFLSTALTNLHL
jgi:hypothetical protein